MKWGTPEISEFDAKIPTNENIFWFQIQMGNIILM